MKLPRNFSSGNNFFRLTSVYLHQLMGAGEKIRRSVKRTQLAQYFRIGVSINLDGRYNDPGETFEKNMWAVADAKQYYGQPGLLIGCVYFEPRAAAILKRWALQPRKADHGKTKGRRNSTS